MTGYSPGEIGIQVLIEAVPEMKQFANVSGEQVANIGSFAMTHEIWLKIANRVNELLASPDVDGIVITHGTDTLEETAYFLNLVVKSDKPVVLVGAMRPATAMSADGPVNLLNAVRLAGSAVAKGKGVLVGMNDQINAARDVTKTNTTHVETFKAWELGYLGYIQNGLPYFYRLSTRKHTAQTEFDVRGLKELPYVEILYGHVNGYRVVVDALVAAGVKGIVHAGMGHGSIFPVTRDALAEAVTKGIPVVKSSRVGNGMVTRIADDDKFNFVAADTLNPQKARILLMLGLTKTKDPKEIQRMFDEY
jgi:L-asparaginase